MMSDVPSRGIEPGETRKETDDERFMALALHQARLAREQGEVPVGAVVVDRGVVMAEGRNGSLERSDPTAHAEILALREAGRRVGNYRLPGMTLYVTVEPCTMCAGALIHARIARLVYGADDPKGGAIRSLYRIMEDGRLNHNVEVRGGVKADEAADLLKAFFKERREIRPR